VAAGPLPRAALGASVFAAGRFVVVNNVLDAEGTSTDDDDDWTARPQHFNACSLDIYHTHKTVQDT